MTDPVIKDIVFDLGGVVLNIDYHKTERAFKSIGFPHFDELYTQFKQSPLFVRFEKGLITPESFLGELRAHSQRKVKDQTLIEAWNAMLLDLPPENLDFITQLKQDYRVFLLSNTNAIHYEAFFDQVEAMLGRRDLAPYFEKEYYSHLIGKRKPDQEVFEFIIRDAGIDPVETLMIDDSPQHLEGAKAVGFHTFNKRQDQGLEEALAPLPLLSR